MNIIGPAKVVHGGTYSGNPISLAAVDATLDILSGGGVYERLESFGRRLVGGIEEVAADAKVDVLVTGVPEMFQLQFTRQHEIREYRDLAKCDMDRYAALHVEMLNHGVMIDEDNMECFFTCTAHTDEDLAVTLAALQKALADIKAGVLHIPKKHKRSGE